MAIDEAYTSWQLKQTKKVHFRPSCRFEFLGGFYTMQFEHPSTQTLSTCLSSH